MIRNIMIVGKSNHLGWVEHVVNAVSNLDNIKSSVFLINKTSGFDSLNKMYFKITSQKSKLNDMILNKFEQHLKRTKPDLILFVSGFFIPLSLYQMAKIYNINTVAWVGDKFGNNIKEYSKYIDKLYVADSAFINIAKDLAFSNVSLLQFGYNKSLHINQKKNRNSTINFVGSYTNDRNNIFMELKEKPLHIEGIGWKKLDDISNNWIVKNKKINQNKLVDIYNQSLATLNIGQNENIINMVNMRTFEAIACGSCIFTDNMSDLEYCFEPNKEVLVYNSIDELKELCDKVIRDRSFILKISENGYNRLLKDNNTYEHRIKTIIDDFK
jgi:spore maturation protein CgeB